MSTREALLARIAAFLETNGLSERRFGILAANDHKLVERIRHQSVTLARIEAAERFMAAYIAPCAEPAPSLPPVRVEAA